MDKDKKDEDVLAKPSFLGGCNIDLGDSFYAGYPVVKGFETEDFQDIVVGFGGNQVTGESGENELENLKWEYTDEVNQEIGSEVPLADNSDIVLDHPLLIKSS